MANRPVLNCVLMTVFLLCLWAGTSSASWLIYHKPAFEGQILDQETKQGIEGAAVVAVYHKWTLGLGAGSTKPVIHVREAVTDKDGKFRIPSYTTLIQPFSGSDDVSFIIYKPGYIGIDYFNLFNYEGLFSGKKHMISEKKVPWIRDNKLTINIKKPNIIELPPAKNNDYRIKAIASALSDEKTWEYQRQLIKLIREEEQMLLSLDPKKHYKLRGD